MVPVLDFNARPLDSEFRIAGSGDATKLLAFEVDGISTATTRTITVPNASGTLPLLEVAQTWTGAQRINSTLSLNAAGSAVSPLLVKQTGDAANPAVTLERSANDSYFRFGYRTTTNSWQFNASFVSTGAYAPISFLTSDLERMVIATSGEVSIGVAPTAGNGLLQLASGTTRANGIAFGTDTFMYRNASNQVTFEGATNVNSVFFLRSSGTGGSFFTLQSAGGTWELTSTSAGDFWLTANGVASNVIRVARTGAVGDSLVILAGGAINLAGASRAIQMNGTQVLANRRTGWTAPTGTATRTGFNTATATVTQVAEALKALIDDFMPATGHGAIGA